MITAIANQVSGEASAFIPIHDQLFAGSAVAEAPAFQQQFVNDDKQDVQNKLKTMDCGNQLVVQT